MATRSAIGIETEDKKIRYIFCYFDGYLSNNGRILADYYTTKALVNKLLDLGDLESLGRIPEGTKDYTEFKQFGKCHLVSYPSAAGIVESEAGYLQVGAKESCSFFYLFKNNQWLCSQANGIKLTEFLPVKSKEDKVEEVKLSKRSKKKSASEDAVNTVTENPVVSEDLPDAAPKDHEDHVDVVPEDETLTAAVTETGDNGSEASVEPSEETNE